jgi:hypothetical protein
VTRRRFVPAEPPGRPSQQEQVTQDHHVETSTRDR